MLRFFSKIRYQLAAENKVGRYLRYAIGEILLVVIGILIALQVNNWNQERLNHIKEKEYLARLLEDFNTLVKQNDSEKKWFKNRLEERQITLSWLHGEHMNDFKKAEIDTGLHNYILSLLPHEIPTTLSELKTTGNMLLISNLELRKTLSSFETSNELYRALINNNLNAQTSFTKELNKHYTLYLSDLDSLQNRTIIFDYDAIKNDPEYIEAYQANTEMAIGIYYNMQSYYKRTIELRDMIKKELEKYN